MRNNLTVKRHASDHVFTTAPQFMTLAEKFDPFGLFTRHAFDMSQTTTSDSVSVLEPERSTDRRGARVPRRDAMGLVSSTRGLRTPRWDAKPMTRVLVVEDDAEMVSMLRSYLSAEGYEVDIAANCAGALEKASAATPDLVLLDIVLGKEDGRDVFRELRLMSDVPTIFLTGRGLETDRIAGLKMGADDYMVKPFSLGEVSARIESVLRRAAGGAQRDADEPSMNFGPLQINELTHEVRLDGEIVELTSKEFALLAFLAASPRRVYSREQLLENVWLSSPEWQGGATVTEHIRRLRSKIEVDPDRPRWITTVRGVGYRFEPAPSDLVPVAEDAQQA
jgi:two-component system, OmpR family, phosphate regulon response regulator PhoB